MNSLQALLVPQPALPERPCTGGFPTLRFLKATIARLSGHRSISSTSGIPHYEGRGWCDATEQEVIMGTAFGRRSAN
jgi:hypothetical protein